MTVATAAPPVPATAPAPAEPVPGAAKDELLIILESGDLERTWGTLIMATSAAAMPVAY